MVAASATSSAVLGLIFTLALPPSHLPVIRADYVRTQTFEENGSVVILEEGSHYLSAAGRYRLDRIFGSESVSEIWRPQVGTKIVLDHAREVALLGPMQVMRQASRIGDAAPSENLGRRALGPLLLDGYRHIVSESGIGDTAMEIWIALLGPQSYGSPPRIVESTTYGLPGGITESMKLVAVRRIVIPPAMMDVPTHYQRREIGHPPQISMLFRDSAEDSPSTRGKNP